MKNFFYYLNESINISSLVDKEIDEFKGYLSRENIDKNKLDEYLKNAKNGKIKYVNLNSVIVKKLKNSQIDEILETEQNKRLEKAKQIAKNNEKRLVIDKIEKDEDEPSIVMKRKNDYYLLAGNTRIITRTALGKPLKVLLFSESL